MKERTIVIATLSQGLCMANIENDRVVELQFESNKANTVSIGDIYVGRVQKVVPSLNAAFVEIDAKTPCYYDIKRNSNPIFTYKIGKKPISESEHLLVQVEKEAVKTKAPTVSSNLNFTGTYVVLTSGNTTISVSSKIKGTERTRLQGILSNYQSDTYGLIARTNAKEVSEEEICKEIKQLIEEYQELVAKSKTRTCFTCLKKAMPSYLAFVRNMYQEDTTRILVDHPTVYEELKSYCSTQIPELAEKIELYEDSQYTLNKKYGLEIRLEESLYKKVWMKSGAYLVIEPTEALTVIDVNSGKCVTKKNMEEQYFKINMEAAIESAHQIRLRNISGIIIIDFINLKDSQKMQEVLKVLKNHLQKDRIPTKLIGVTKLQLVEITRKKTHKSIQESWREHRE